LVEWLLQHEQGILQNDDLYQWNEPQSELILSLVVQYLHADMVYLDRISALSLETAFYNPEQDEVFDMDDWDWLMSEPSEAAVSQVGRHWDDNYTAFQYTKLMWWGPNEPQPAGVDGADYVMYEFGSRTVARQYYAFASR
jgi:hypothetical protein